MFVCIRITCVYMLITGAMLYIRNIKILHTLDVLGPFSMGMAILIMISLYFYIKTETNNILMLFSNFMIIYLSLIVIGLCYQFCLPATYDYPMSDFAEKTDHIFGFDWFEFNRIINKYNVLSSGLTYSYRIGIYEFPLVLIILMISGEIQKCFELMLAYIIVEFICISSFAAFDVRSFDGATAYTISGFHHPVGSSPDYLALVGRLRKGEAPVVDFDHLLGLVSFPSLHAAAALVILTATRSLPRLWLLFFLFNIAVIISAITDGGHNFADIMAGCAVAIFAYYLSQRILTSSSPDEQIEPA